MLNHDAQLDQMFQALADSNRRAMVERLSRGPISVSELAQPFQISLPAVMQHLQILESSGLVRSEKVGRIRTCSLQPEAISQVEQWLRDRKAGWERRFDRLGQYLAENPEED